ncbi:MAG TPA: hypothetical protein VE177_05065, partial [Candidatus Binatus sp.]|nr:hypothetical protein [Candidatus Binatus sp.]
QGIDRFRSRASVGHPDMPEFFFESEDITAILAYLNSIQGAITGRSERYDEGDDLKHDCGADRLDLLGLQV